MSGSVDIMESSGGDVCFPVSSVMLLVLNVILHIFFVYAFLSAFFMLYVSKIETAAFRQEFDNVVHDSLTAALTQADQQSHGRIKPILQDMQPILQVMATSYQKTSPEVTVNNRWLFTVMISIGVLLLTSFAGVVTILKQSCSTATCIPLAHLIQENLLIFLVIGAAEFLFFTRIAAKFIPVPPSLLVSTLIDRVKTNLG